MQINPVGLGDTSYSTSPVDCEESGNLITKKRTVQVKKANPDSID
jgi:hypothetical protein